MVVGASSYVFTCLFNKLSLGLGYLRILINSNSRYVCYAIMIFSTAINLEGAFYTLFRCGGDPSTISEKAFRGECQTLNFASRFQAYLQATSNVLFDFGLTLLPLIAVLQTTLDWRKKASVAFILALAGG
jgi:hypothetical protein